MRNLIFISLFLSVFISAEEPTVVDFSQYERQKNAVLEDEPNVVEYSLHQEYIEQNELDSTVPNRVVLNESSYKSENFEVADESSAVGNQNFVNANESEVSRDSVEEVDSWGDSENDVSGEVENNDQKNDAAYLPSRKSTIIWPEFMPIAAGVCALLLVLLLL